MNEKQIGVFTNLREILDGLMEELGRENAGYVCTFSYQAPNGKILTLQHTGGDIKDKVQKAGNILFEKNMEPLRDN